MASGSPAKKKRKVHSTDVNLKVLKGAERSDNSPCLADSLKEKELWFFQLPKDFDPKLLHGLKIKPGGVKQLKGHEAYKVESHLTSESSQNHVVLSPSGQGKLQISPPLQGYVSVQQSVVTLPVIVPPPSTEPKVVVPRPLKKRWKPFGYKKPCKHRGEFKL